MNLTINSFSIPKKDNTDDQNEDVFDVKKFQFNDKEFFRISLSDGATESYLSKKWAETLVQEFGCFPQIHSDNNFYDFIESAQKTFNIWKKKYPDLREAEGRPLLFSEDFRLLEGSDATFLGVNIQNDVNSNGKYWSAISIGDTCLFQIREEFIFSHPLQFSEEFNNSPNLLSSKGSRDFIKIKYIEKKWCYGDIVYLMTDAISCWFLQEYENGNEPWITLDNITTQEEFNMFITDLRQKKMIRNDDVTMICIKFNK
jgi:hypothetical protein